MSESTSQSINSLQDALESEEFPSLDLALRRGYGFLIDAQAVLEEFYGRYGCDLIQRTDGYFFLLPTGERLRKKHLSTGAMLVGQALALLYLDPATAGLGGLVSKDQLLAQLDGVVGTDALIRSFNPKRRRYDERVAQETVRKKVAVEVRRLAGLGFVELAADDQIRLRPALLRFAEPVRGLADPAEALAKLVASGEVQLTEEPMMDSDEMRDEERPKAADEESVTAQGIDFESGAESEFADSESGADFESGAESESDDNESAVAAETLRSSDD